MSSHRLTAEELDAAACEWAERTALEQGKPAGITDPVWLDRLATFMTSTPAPPAAGRPAEPFPPGTATGPEPATATRAGRAPSPNAA